MQEDGDLKPKEEHSPEDRGRDTSTKEDDSREWKKSGTLVAGFLIVAILKPRAEDRWIEWLDSKLALLLDRDSVDPHAYGGKGYDE